MGQKTGKGLMQHGMIEGELAKIRSNKITQFYGY